MIKEQTMQYCLNKQAKQQLFDTFSTLTKAIISVFITYAFAISMVLFIKPVLYQDINEWVAWCSVITTLVMLSVVIVLLGSWFIKNLEPCYR